MTGLPEALDKLITTADLSRPDRMKAREVLARNADVFSLSKYDLGRTNVTQHDIPLVAGLTPSNNVHTDMDRHRKLR